MSGCNKAYVEETKRQLETQKHCRYVKNNDMSSMIAKLCIDYKHMFDLENLSIVEGERNLQKRSFLRLHIHFNCDNVNQKIGTQFLKNFFKRII